MINFWWLLTFTVRKTAPWYLNNHLCFCYLKNLFNYDNKQNSNSFFTLFCSKSTYDTLGRSENITGVMDTLKCSSGWGKLEKQVSQFESKLTVQRYKTTVITGTSCFFKLWWDLPAPQWAQGGWGSRGLTPQLVLLLHSLGPALKCPWDFSPSHPHTGVGYGTSRGYPMLIGLFKFPRGLVIGSGCMGLQVMSTASGAGGGGAAGALAAMAPQSPSPSRAASQPQLHPGIHKYKWLHFHSTL